MLLEHNAGVTLQDTDSMTALHWATNGGHKGIVESLMKSRMPLNSKDWLGRSALHHALRRRDYGIAEVLVRSEVFLYSPKQLEGALNWTAQQGSDNGNGNGAIIGALLFWGLDPNEYDGHRVTALMHAAACGGER